MNLEGFKSEWLQIWGYKEGTKEAEEAWKAKVKMHESPIMAFPMIISEERNYKPYKSMVTGEMIDGRKKHREHLKRHNVVEAADLPTTPKVERKPDNLKEQVARQVYEKLRY